MLPIFVLLSESLTVWQCIVINNLCFVPFLEGFTLCLYLSGNSGSRTRVKLQQPQERRYPVLQVHAGFFRVSVIHRTLTWTTGFLTRVRDHSYEGGLHTDIVIVITMIISVGITIITNIIVVIIIICIIISSPSSSYLLPQDHYDSKQTNV